MTEGHRFELRRFPSLHGLGVSVVVSVTIAINACRDLKHSLIFGSALLVYWVWLFSRPAATLSISDTELVAKIDWLRVITIKRQLADEVAPSSNGVIISWKKKKGGVPYYTEIRASWFQQAVWQKAYAELLSWVKLTSQAPTSGIVA